MKTNELFTILKLSLYGGDIALQNDFDYETIFTELQAQTCLSLTKDIAGDIPMSKDLRGKWEQALNRQLAANAKVVFEERKIFAALATAGVPCAVLKGSAVAQYYPKPELRSRGDIDILVQKDRFEDAAGVLLDNGFKANGGINPEAKHVEFKKNDVEIELHSRFFETEEQNALLYSAIDSIVEKSGTPVLSDILNALVVLYHIKYHLSFGIGLRQFIDWFMFVNSVLSDELWRGGFEELAEKFGLGTLAKAAAKLGVQLGLIERKITWCEDVEDELCKMLLEQVLRNGNFGYKESDIARKTATVLTTKLSPLSVFRILHVRGIEAWPAAREHPALRPLAGLRLAALYAQRIASGNAVADIKRQKREAEKRQELLKKLGI